MSDDRITASVYIIACDEEHNLRRALDSVRRFDDIVVVDSGSSDATPDIAREYTDRVIHHEWTGYAGQKRFALGQCRHPWVLNIDADEAVTPELEQEIIGLMKRGDADGLDIPIVDRFLGRSMHSRPNRRIRFFRRDRGRYDETAVHESIRIDGKVVAARHPLLHYSLPSIEFRLQKQNRYSSLKAAEKRQQGRQAGLLKLLFAMPVSFFKSLLLRGGWRDGTRGFINTMMTSYYAFLKEAKLYELQVNDEDASRSMGSDSIGSNNQEEKKK